MSHPIRFVTPVGYVAAIFLFHCALPARAADSTEVKRLFANPPREYSTVPFWVWNDDLTDDQVVTTLRELAGRGIHEVFVHPRPGLMTPYLGPEWFRLWNVALKEAARLDMNLWIYDENSYPSGFAGGHVPEAMPESRGRGLAIREEKTPPKNSDDLVAVFRRTGDAYDDVTNSVRAGGDLPEAAYLTFAVQRSGNSPWFGGRCYVDLLYPGVTEKFLSITLDPYEREFGPQLGKRIPGVFTDEPELLPAGGLPWTADLPQQFEQRWGYSLLEHLPSLDRPVGDWRLIRHNYYQTLLDLFIARWAQPYYERCQRRGLEFTGHYWEHEWPRCLQVPDNMALSAWQQRPGIDTLMNEYAEETHAQFGNVRAVKELASVANQLGRRRTLCEAYGAAGWDLRFADMKRIGDWLYALGVNTLNQHLSYVSIRGMRKRDHPPSFSYHEPWWEAYKTSATYFARLSAALSQGDQINPVLLLEPTTTAWMYQTAAGNDPHLDELGKTFQRLVVDLEKAQVECDLGCEDILARHGSISEQALVVGQRRYRTIVIPPLMENLNARTAALLEEFVKAGGTVLCCGDPPSRVDGGTSERITELAGRAPWKKTEVGAVAAELQRLATDGFVIRPTPAQTGLLFHHRRQLADGQLLFLVNTSNEAPASGIVEARAGSVERWDIETGATEPYPFEAPAADSVRMTLDLPPCGSVLLLLSNERRDPVPRHEVQTTTIAAEGPPRVRRVEPNVLVLDFVDITAGDETRRGIYVLAAADFACKKNGLDRNLWEGAIQFGDELNSTTFAPDSGFEATYRFTIEDRVPSPLFAVVERPDLYTITCNGLEVWPTCDSWWLDRVFLRIDIAAAAKVGENLLQLKASPFTIYTELESAYVLGNFALRASDGGFVMVPPAELKLGPWNQQGHPFYAAGFSYAESFAVPAPSGHYDVSLPEWCGSVAAVRVNGEPAGFVAYPPWECDVTRLIKAGSSDVEVTVIGSLKNTLGPHHGNPPPGRAWPGMFRQAPASGPPPGGSYSTVGYGLFQPFVLKHEAD